MRTRIRSLRQRAGTAAVPEVKPPPTFEDSTVYGISPIPCILNRCPAKDGVPGVSGPALCIVRIGQAGLFISVIYRFIGGSSLFSSLQRFWTPVFPPSVAELLRPSSAAACRREAEIPLTGATEDGEDGHRSDDFQRSHQIRWKMITDC